MPIVGQFGSLAGPGFFVPGGAFESIATVTVGSGGASSIEFTSIPGTYQHLQLRAISRHNTADRVAVFTFNNDATGYAHHRLFGNGSSVTAAASTNATELWAHFGSPSTADAVGGFVLDILDYADTSKNTTVRSFGGTDANGNGHVTLLSGLWIDTGAVTSIKFTVDGDFEQHTSYSLYGVRS